jgi:transcriptional regulator with XRE-family HTH domain
MRPDGNRHLLAQFGAKVRDFRQRQSISQEELADRAGVHRTYIGMIERGEKNPTLLSIQRVSLALDVEISALLDGLPNGE